MKKPITNKDRFLQGDVFLSADGREMYFEIAYAGEKYSKRIMLDGKFFGQAKEFEAEFFTVVLPTIGKKTITEKVEYSKLTFVD